MCSNSTYVITLRGITMYNQSHGPPELLVNVDGSGTRARAKRHKGQLEVVNILATGHTGTVYKGPGVAVPVLSVDSSLKSGLCNSVFIFR